MQSNGTLRRGSTGRTFGWLVTAITSLIVVGISECQAQCVDSSERVLPNVIQTFATDPASLLDQLRNDKEKLSGRLTAYIATDISTLTAVRKLVSLATDADRTAIGISLHRAEERCLIMKPEAARKIQEFVGKLGDNAVLSGYATEIDEPAVVAASPPPKSAGSNTDLLTGEWKTEIMDPFAPVPLPQ